MGDLADLLDDSYAAWTVAVEQPLERWEYPASAAARWIPPERATENWVPAIRIDIAKPS